MEEFEGNGGTAVSTVYVMDVDTIYAPAVSIVYAPAVSAVYASVVSSVYAPVFLQRDQLPVLKTLLF